MALMTSANWVYAAPSNTLYKALLRADCAGKYDAATCACWDTWVKRIDTILECQIVIGRMIARMNIAGAECTGLPAGTELVTSVPGITDYVVPQLAQNHSIKNQPWDSSLEVCNQQIKAADITIDLYQGYVAAAHDVETLFRACVGKPPAIKPTPPS